MCRIFQLNHLVIKWDDQYFQHRAGAKPSIDSDGDGTVNAGDPTPFFVASSLNFALNGDQPAAVDGTAQVQTLIGSTNYLYYRTN